MIILGIETSCDETAAAVIEVKKDSLKILSNIISSQIELHTQWGGVVPNLAAREHLKNIAPVIDAALREANIVPEKIDLLAATQGPGLIPALLIGTMTAKTLSYVWKKPLLGINHIEGHIYSNFLEFGVEKKEAAINFPAITLVVSGGHTQLVLMRSHLEYEIIGETVDDAAGEAFDKVARLLNLGYPGGPQISKLAEQFSPEIANRFGFLKFPRPMAKSQNFNFSFSGLKTAVLYMTKKHVAELSNPEFVIALCHEFQQAVIDVLILKTLAAAEKFNAKAVMIAGGVSANKELRRQLEIALRENHSDIIFNSPSARYSVDNAVMIAGAASYRYRSMSQEEKNNLQENWKEMKTNANLRIK
jgi:N6-L-threonylcarbamoyladenine synthase